MSVIEMFVYFKRLPFIPQNIRKSKSELLVEWGEKMIEAFNHLAEVQLDEKTGQRIGRLIQEDFFLYRKYLLSANSLYMLSLIACTFYIVHFVTYMYIFLLPLINNFNSFVGSSHFYFYIFSIHRKCSTFNLPLF